MSEYVVWKQNVPDSGFGGGWHETSHTILAKTNKEAQAKLRRKFAGCGFHAMRLIALPRGSRPDA